MAIPSINSSIKYINSKLTGANWNSNLQTIVNWFTDGTADVSFSSIRGNITGDVIGNIIGNVTGNLTGNVTGNIIGNTTGNVYATNGTSIILNTGTNGSDFSSPLVPVSTIWEYAGRTAPNGFLMVNGTAVSRTTYLNLFNVLCPLIGTAAITLATPGYITINSHGLITGDQVYFTTTGALPTGLTANTLYYVIYVNDNIIRLATSRANAFTFSLISTCAITIGTPASVNSVNHGLITGDQVSLTTTGTLPTGLTANTIYYVIYVNSDQFRLATSRANALAGIAINTSGTYSGTASFYGLTAINTSGSQSGTQSLYSCNYGLGDGSTTFNLPDMREAAPVGIGTRASGVTAHDTFTLGQFKDDQMQGHYHSLHSNTTTPISSLYPATGNAGVSDLTDAVRSPITDGTNGTPRTGTTTRGKQLGVNFIIKY
jgi:microcystin-dependent protein